MMPRPVRALLLLLFVPPAVGALIAPHIFAHVTPLLHRIAPDFHSFDNPEFIRILDRCVLGVAIAMLVPTIRMSGLAPRIRDALRLTAPRVRTLALAIVIGLASMGIAYFIGWLFGGYRVDGDVRGWWHVLGRAAFFLFGAVFVGVFEEVFFRGFVFGAIRTRLAFPVAAAIASLFFMSMHFLHPKLAAEFDGTRWNAGFAVAPEILGAFDLKRDGAFAVTLFLMGLTLCRLYESDGHLWRCVGLHGGWVWAMQTGAFVLNHNWAILRPLLGPSDYIAQGPVAIPIIGAFLVWSFAGMSKKRPSGAL